MQRFSRVIGVVGSAALVAAAATGCAAQNHAGGAGIVTTGAYVQEPASTGQATVGYLDIRNNGPADSLVSVSTSVGGTVELRGPDGRGQSSVLMHTVPSIPLPANATTQLVPTSYHLLITGAGAMHDGKDIQLTLKFAHATSITVYALVTNPQNGGSSYFIN
ncbi:MAG TPA: copper chaperone PCu(A)C [Trebonia sp.]|nr:copper chaperone PCu(A)C [Trebonia sp.]